MIYYLSKCHSLSFSLPLHPFLFFSHQISKRIMNMKNTFDIFRMLALFISSDYLMPTLDLSICVLAILEILPSTLSVLLIHMQPLSPGAGYLFVKEKGILLRYFFSANARDLGPELA